VADGRFLINNNFPKIVKYVMLTILFSSASLIRGGTADIILNQIPISDEIKLCMNGTLYLITTGSFLFWCHTTRQKHKSLDNIFCEKYLRNLGK